MSHNISWDQYFMGVAILSSMRSKDPSTQVGACIVDHENIIVGIGYNGFPSKIKDEWLTWERTSKNYNETKYPYVIHAELNAILNSKQVTLKGCKLYVTLFPCNECAKIIIQSGIEDVIYLKKPNEDRYRISFEASEKLFLLANVNVIEYDSLCYGTLNFIQK